MDREAGKELLYVEGLTKTIDGKKVLDNVTFRLNKGDKIAFVGENEIANTTLFKILMGEMEADSGEFKWGVSTSQSYFPRYYKVARTVYYGNYGNIFARISWENVVFG